MSSGKQLAQYRAKTRPLKKLPHSLQEALCIHRIGEDGIFELEQQSADHVFDKGYVFQDINYVTKDAEEKEELLRKWCKVLNSMNVSFKITIANLNRNMQKFRQEILYRTDQKLPKLAKANNELILSQLKKGNPEVEQFHFFTISCRAKNYTEAKSYFNVLEAAVSPIFLSMKSSFTPLSAGERLQILHQCFCSSAEELHWSWEEAISTGRNWKNEILPDFVKKEKAYLELGERFVCVLYAQQLPSRLDESRLLSDFTQMPFPMLLSLDLASLPQSVLKNHLLRAYSNNEYAITRESETKFKKHQEKSEISFSKKKMREELEGYISQMEQQDENAFYMGLSLTVYASSKEELLERTHTLAAIAGGHGIHLEAYHYRQWEAFQSALPTGIRLVDTMRLMLTSSLAAFQPFYAQEISDAGGIYYGVNRYTKNPVLADRKKLTNPNGMVFGIPGSGKSMFIKTEIGQVRTAFSDDIFIIDPQNEFERITEQFGGQFYDFSADAQVFLNPLELPQSLEQENDPLILEKFISSQSGFLQAFCSAIMTDLSYNGFHTALIDRTVRQLYGQIFQKTTRSSPTLADFRSLLGKQKEPEARQIYLPLEAFTEGSMQMFARQSNVKLNQSFVAFGLKKITEAMRRPAMLMILHVLQNRMDFNQEQQRATWFYVDEAQEVCKDAMSANELNKCFLTFRKFGGICTAILQNLSRGLVHQVTRDMISDSEFKVFFRQGGSDRNAAAEIMDFSREELRAMTEAGVGEALLCCGQQTVQMNTQIPHRNPLYELYSTNFHERAKNER